MEKEEKIRVIITVPNQKVITVNKSICDGEHIYATCNLKANKMALKELSPNTYKLYMYFALNQNDYSFALSYVHVYSITGMSEKTYHRAVKELIDKGYLVKEEGKKNQYIFYDGKIDGEYSLVKNTGQESQVDQDDETKISDKSSQKGNSRTVVVTGEILQDNTNNNTLDINIAPDTSGAEVADAPLADASSSNEPEREIEIFEKKLITEADLNRFNYHELPTNSVEYNDTLKTLIYNMDYKATLKDFIEAAISLNAIGKNYTCSYIKKYINGEV